MFGFGVSEKDLVAKIQVVRELTDSGSASGDMSMSAINDMGMLAMQFDTIASRFANGAIPKSEWKSTLSELKGLEKQARKVLKK